MSLGSWRGKEYEDVRGLEDVGMREHGTVE